MTSQQATRRFVAWNSRFYPELIDEIMALTLQVQARYVEELLREVPSGDDV